MKTKFNTKLDGEKFIKMLPIIIMVVIALSTAEIQQAILAPIGISVLMGDLSTLVKGLLPVAIIGGLVFRDISIIINSDKVEYIGLVTLMLTILYITFF